LEFLLNKEADFERAMELLDFDSPNKDKSEIENAEPLNEKEKEEMISL